MMANARWVLDDEMGEFWRLYAAGEADRARLRLYHRICERNATFCGSRADWDNAFFGLPAPSHVEFTA